MIHSTWRSVAKFENVYDYSSIDWPSAMAEQHNATGMDRASLNESTFLDCCGHGIYLRVCQSSRAIH